MSEGGYVARDKPVIGVLLQDLSVSLRMKYTDEDYTSSLGASYAKFVEDSGGRCLPIALRQNPKYYQHIVELVDGILLPGGGFSLANSSGYTPSGRLLLDAVNAAAKNGKITPVFGICLGFELMAVYFSGNDDQSFDILTGIPINKGWHNLGFTDESAKSAHLSAEMLEGLRENSLSHFFHRQCVTEEKFSWLGNDWRVLATEKVIGEETGEKVTVITILESKTRPYFGVQFHPEKGVHESGPRKLCSNIGSAEAATKIFNNLFARMVQAHKVSHNFPEGQLKRLIDRHTPEDLRNDDEIKYDFVYMFREGDLII